MPEHIYQEGDYITPMNKMATIIDSVGDYVRRDGKRVTIHAIKPTLTLSTTAFHAKGSTWKKNDKIDNNPPYGIWHISGRHYCFGSPSRHYRKME